MEFHCRFSGSVENRMLLIGNLLMGPFHRSKSSVCIEIRTFTHIFKRILILAPRKVDKKTRI